MGPKKRKSRDIEKEAAVAAAEKESLPKPEKRQKRASVKKETASQNKKAQKPVDSKYFKKKSLDPSEPSTSSSGSSPREVTVDQTLNVDKVKEMIKDRENKRTKAAKRLADLPPTEFNQSTMENSPNMLNMDPVNKSGNRNKKKVSKKKIKEGEKKSEEEVDFSVFPNVTKFFLGRQVFGKGCIPNREVCVLGLIKI